MTLALIIVPLFLIAYFVFAESIKAPRVEIQTINVFPEHIAGIGWSNLDTLNNQNVSSFSLYQEFNSINSASPKESSARQLRERNEQKDAEMETGDNTTGEQNDTLILPVTGADQSSSTSETVSDQQGESSSSVDQETITSDSEDDLSEEQQSNQNEPEQETVDFVEDGNQHSESIEQSIDTEGASDAASVDAPDDQSEESTEADDEEQTALRKVGKFFESVFAAVSETFPFAQSTDVATSAHDKRDGETLQDEPLLIADEEVSSTTKTQAIAASSTKQGIVQGTSTASSTQTEEPDSIVEAEVMEKSDETEKDTDETDCQEKCTPYVITLSGFGLPIFEENTDFSGAQLRMSFAAKRKSTREQIQAVRVRYSFDEGNSWGDGGSIVIDDEASNSINGGYYLFSLPQITDPDLFDNLVVQIVYEEDLSELENLFVESVWLEVFVAKTPDLYELSTAELLADDNYNYDLLNGDELVLPDGEVISFDNTDENDEETLIIKSDKVVYNGLSKATAYINVTNTSSDEDTFVLKTYFPRDGGALIDLKEWNPNKPKQVVIPEYRPFVYYCEAGWEQLENPIGVPLKEVSKQLTGDTGTSSDKNSEADFQIPVTDTEALPFSTSTEEQTTASTTEEREGEFEEASSSQPFTQLTNIVSNGSTSLAGVLDQTLIIGNSAIADASSTTLYTCRDTSVVRGCDALEGDNTSCRIDNVKVREHEVTRYSGGWEKEVIESGTPKDSRNFLKKVTDFLGFGPRQKEVPDQFAVRSHTPDSYAIKAGETKYFKLELSFPPHTHGEWWVEAVGDSEYGLLDPFWNSQWHYRMPITIDNTGSNDALTEYQVFLELDNSLTDFWSNVQSDGSDIRFVQEVDSGNEQNWYGTGWSSRVPITIQSSQVDSTLTDFPVYVDLSDFGSSFFSSVQTDGDDIRITQSDGQTEVPFELVSINTGSETGELHFKANSISASADTVFYLYFGNPNVSGYNETDTYGAQNVWNSSFIATYHLEEESSGIGNSGLYTDSTSNEYDADDEVNSTGQSGKLGNGQEIRARESNPDDYILVPSDALNGENELTFSFWMNTSQNGDQSIINAGANNELIIFLRNTQLTLYDGGANDTFTLDTDVTGTGWRYMTVVRDANSGQWLLYIDGVADNQNPLSESMSALSVPSSCIMIGGEQDGSCLSVDDNQQNYDGYLDEFRLQNTVVDSDWIAASYRNQSTTTDFYAVGSSESYTTATFSELDYWVQYFDTSSDEADVWVQMNSVAANASTTIYLYYGNDSASSASDEENTFTYSTTTDLYYVVDGNSTGNIVVYSLIDDNVVSIDGGTPVSLDEGASTVFSSYASSSVISALGPISATIDDDFADSISPIAFASTTHAVPTSRNTSRYFIHSPFGSAQVNTYIGNSGTADETFTIATGTTAVSNTDANGNDGVIIEASLPVLVYHQESSRDSIISYPPTTRDLFGIDSNNTQITTLTDDPDPSVYCSSGESGTATGVTRGEAQGENSCTDANDGAGPALRFTGAQYPVAAIQQADGDGSESTAFWSQQEFSTQYYMTTDSAYAAVACSPRFGTSSIEVQTSVGVTVETATCAPSGQFPGKAYFVNGQNGDSLAFTAGHQIVSTNGVPFYVIYEDDEEDNDETNILGAVQARKYAGYDMSYSIGAQELNIDAEYEQYSYGWYQNIDAQTPTTTWSLGDDGNVEEAEEISGQGAVNNGDVLRLRMSLRANVATGTADSAAFTLQYAAAQTCSTADSWFDVGGVGSTTAAFSGYNNGSISDGEILTTTLLASSTVYETYEESNISAYLQNDINPGEIAEWDWVITSSNVQTNTEYCFRMIRSTKNELVTYSKYPKLVTSGPPEATALIKRFDNEHASSTQPALEFVASDFSSDDLHYQVQIDTDIDFTSPALDQNSQTNFLQFENTSVPSDKAPFNSGQVIRYTPPSSLTSSTTYWWRVRSIDPDGSNTYSEWSDPYSFTVDESVTVSEWYQTTDEQFQTNTLVSATTSGSGSVTLDIGGSSIIGEYGSVTVSNGATTTVSLNNTYTNPVVTASVEYSRSVPNGDQPTVRVFNKSGSGFDVISDNYTNDAPGTSTVHYVVMEAGEYLFDDGSDGLRVYATSTSVSSYIGSPISGDPGTDVLFPTSFSAAPAVLSAVTTKNDPDWILPGIYDGNDVANPPTASQIGLYLHDDQASDGHSASENIDIIAFDTGYGSNNGVAFDIFNTGIDPGGAYVDDSPDTFVFNQTFSSPPGVRAVQQLTMTGNQGSNAMVDTDTPVTFSTITLAVDEGGTNGARSHADENVTVVTFENASGDIIRSGSAQMTSTAIDFDDGDVGNAWGEVLFTDSGDVTYTLEYQTGSGFNKIPDSDLPGNSSGFTTSPINILSLDTDTYNEIRLVADFSGVDPELYNWSVAWGQRVDIPVLGDPFDNEKIATTTPVFDFVSTDPQGDKLEYEISWSADNTFQTSTTTRLSSVSLNFKNIASSTESDPYTSGDTITYSMEPSEALTNGATYWWRVRAKDPYGNDAFSPWSDPDSFTIDTGTTVSTWYQTTQEQFEEGVLDGLVASSSDSVVVSSEIGEYGTTTVTNNNWKTITTNLTYNNMVVVASPEYGFNGTDNGRTVQVKNKTNNSFQIKAENYTESLSGSTDVNYIVFEAGDWLIQDGGSGVRVIAGTAEDVSTVKGSSSGYTGGTQVVFSPSFSSPPVALTTVSTANGSKWVGSFVDDGTQAGEVTTSDMYVSLGISLDSDTVRVPEDIDYVVFEESTGLNNATLFDAFNSSDSVSDSDTSIAYNQSFSTAPGVVVMQNNANDGGDGAFAQQDTDTVSTASTLYASAAEIGSSAGAHTNEIISVVAFESDNGTIRREAAAVGLSGTVGSEPILFSDGTGPKFERALFSATTPGTSSTTVQVQYLTSTSSWQIIPDSQIAGNSTGFNSSPIDLTGIDAVTYPTIRLFATLTCDVSNCPTLDDWTVEWSEGVPVSGTIKEYDRITNVTSGTVRVAVNGIPGSTGSIAGDGTWSINNVTAFGGDVVTVWVDGANDENEAVGVFVYDGVGDMTGLELFEQHLSISSDENATTTNALLSLYDNSVSSDEDIFFDVDGNNDLSLCVVSGCTNANLYIGNGNVYMPDSTGSGNVITHDFVNNGTVDFDSNVVRVSGSWNNLAQLDAANSTVIFTATSSSETVNDSDNVLDFNSLTFGETAGSATWKTYDPITLTGSLSVNFGTLNRSSSTIVVAKNFSVGANGYLAGISTTTFNGSGSSLWTDTNTIKQNIGHTVIDGSSKTITLGSSVLASSVTIGANDTLNAGGANTLSLLGNFVNNNVFTAQTGTIEITGDSTNAVITQGGSSLYNFTASTTGTGSVSFSQSNITLLGSFTIATGTVTLPTATTSIGGSFTNSGGLFAHNNGEVRFTGSGNKTITSNGGVFFNNFYAVSFVGTGNWTFLDTNATTTNNFTITNGTVTLPGGQLSVGRDYTVSGSGAFIHNNGEVLFLINGNDTVTTNSSAFNDVRIKGGTGGSSQWYDENWQYRIPVTVRSSAVDEDLSDFPVYVDMADLPSAFFSSINSGGSDIRVTKGDGVTEVAREIVSASTTIQTGEMYFQASDVSSTTDSTFYLYYGNSSASDYAVTDTYGAENVWSNGYVLVAHLNDDTTSTVINSANGSLDGTKDAANQPQETDLGKIYEGQDHGGTGHIEFGNVGGGATNITISAWFNADNLTGSGDTNTYGYTIFSAHSAGAYTWLTAGGTGNGGSTDEVRFCAFSSSAVCTVASGSNIGINQWHYVSATAVDGGAANVRVDGSGVLSFASDGGGSWNSGSTIGDLRPDRNIEFEGIVDEVQISNVVRSVAWQDATYRNQSTTTDFYAVGSPQQDDVRTFASTNVTAEGDVVIESGTAVFPSGVFSIGGSFDNNDQFDSNSGTVTFNSASGAETVAAGNSLFYNLDFDSVGGQWNVTEHATATNSINFDAANVLTVDPGVVLTTEGTFTNSLNNASTTWTGATLKLGGGTDFSINTKSNEGDDYDTLSVIGDGDIRMWNSTASVYDTKDSSSIYSQDHSGSDGDLYIFGDYVRENGIEYWTYATDFDGLDLTASSSERQVHVRIANNASVTASSSVLSIIGTSSASTTIDAQSGSFGLTAQNATVTATYFTLTGTDATGFALISSSTVTLFDNALFTISGASSAITVDASTIDSNPASQFFHTNFISGGGDVNVTLSGSPSSYWWFRDGTGDRYGEAYDYLDLDPGSIRWDDSSYQIDISGIIYADDGSSTIGPSVCNGITNVVTIVVDGGTYTDSVPCNGLDSSYVFNNVSYNGDATIVVYLDNAPGGEYGSVVTKTPTTNITDFDIYAHRVVTRHEDTSPLTIEDMSIYDETDDADLRYVAATGTTDTLAVRPDTELYVFATTTFAPGGEIVLESGGTGNVYDGTLHLGQGSVFSGEGTTTYRVGGSLMLETGALLNTASSTFDMTATTSGKTITASSTLEFNELQFSGVGGGWHLNTDITVLGDLYAATGTITGTEDVTLASGSLYGDGIVSFGSGTVSIADTNALGGNQAWTFSNLTLGNGIVSGTTTPLSNATTTVSGTLTIATGHFLDAGNSIWNFTGSGNVFVENGTFVEDTSTVQYGGVFGSNVLGTTYYDLKVNASGGSPLFSANSLGIQVLNDLTIGGLSTTTLSLDVNDPAVSVQGDVHILSEGSLIGSDSIPLSVFGSWYNDGVFNANTGEVQFLGSTPVSIEAGNSSFNNLTVSGSGTLTFTENATTTGTLTYASSSSSVVNSGITLAVGTAFVHQSPGSNTTWTGSTLYLYGGDYQMNASSTSDVFETLRIGPNAEVRMWNMDASAIVVDSGGSLYSMDHATVDGNLYIYGTYTNEVRDDFWSYTTDFDGTDLSGGAQRQVQVFVQENGSVLYTGGSLEVVGTSFATTTLQNQGAGTYSFIIGGDTSFDGSYLSVRDIDAAGVTFSGTPNVANFDNTDLLVAQENGAAITVGGTVINSNPARNFQNNLFGKGGSVTNATSVHATGTSVSSWRYTNHIGNVAGEAFDNDPGGDPGYIVWDDSAAIISISGNVYQSDTATVSSVCDDVTNNIVLAVDGSLAQAASSSCSSATGAYTISGVSFSPNDTLTLYINNESVKAVNVSIDPISSIGDMDLYENHVIVRHENTDPITIDDMSAWDTFDDADIPFIALNSSPDVLVLSANTKLLVWDNKEFAPGGNVTLVGSGSGAAYDGTLELKTGAVFTAQNNESHSIGGSFVLNASASFEAAQSTVTFTTTGSSRTVDVNEANFYNAVFNGPGSWVFTDANVNVANDLTITNGSVTFPTGTSTIGGSFTNNSSFDANSGTFYFNASSTGKNIQLGGSNVHDIIFDGIGGSWSFVDIHATSTGFFAVKEGVVTLPSGTVSVNGDFTVEDSINHNSGTLVMGSNTGTSTITLSGEDLNSLSILGSSDFVMTDSSASFLGDLIVANGSLAISTTTLSVGGSLDATGGTLNTASGTILFNSSDIGETVAVGENTFYNVVFGSASGGWTLYNATTTNNFVLSSASSFTLASGNTLAVNGVFTNSVGGANTTWSGSTVILDSGDSYSINTKSVSGDVYETVSVGFDTDLRMWNSSANSIVLASTSASLYSQDHGSIDGDLYIYGVFKIATGTEYWNYATDFDGTALTGGSRRGAHVYFVDQATSSVLVTGGSLQIVGDETATTTIQSSSGGNYAFSVTGGVFNAEYYSFSDLNSSGLLLEGTPILTSLDNGFFDLAVDTGTLITLSSTTLNANASKFISNTGFFATSTLTGVNVTVIGTTSSAWRFINEYGSLSGESFDIDGADACGSIRWTDSSCLLTEQTHYRWRNDDGGLGVPDSEWFDSNWGKRKRVRFENQDANSYATTSVKVPVPYDSDMSSDFADIRFTKVDGVTEVSYWIEKYTAGTDAVIWVEVPPLNAKGTTDLFMYYDNAAATTTSSSTAVFAVADDFEDNDIAEYSGDTGLFTVAGSFAYGGSSGLDTSGFESSRATDGIGRTDVVVGQGEIIRYMQYVDTGVGAADEACTLFGVQSVVGNTNYGVCLEQFGTDRMTLAKNVESTDTYGSVVQLASTSVSYSTGWYEVEIDWQTDNTISVYLYNDSGVLVASTSAADSSYSSGGIGFTYWGQNGGWDDITSRNRTDTKPEIYFGAEQIPGGATWNNVLDTPSSGFEVGDVARLRVAVENFGLNITDQEFQLEYAPKGGSPSCESVSALSYAVVPTLASCGTSPLCMATTSAFTTGDATVDLLEGTQKTFTAGQAIEDPNNKTNIFDVDQDHYTEVEFALSSTAYVSDESYCLRVTNNGSDLDSYASVGEFALQFAPLLSVFTLNGGNDIVLLPDATTTVYATGTVTDLNGYADLAFATTTFYRSGVGAACVQDNNNCYISSGSPQCVFTHCSGNSCDVECAADFYYHADPTDSGAYDGEEWFAFGEVEDVGGESDFNTAPGVELLTLRALSVDSAINYGSLSVNEDTGSNNASTTVENIGNDSIDVQIVGEDLSDGSSSVIPATQQIFATSTFTYSSCTNCTSLSTTSVTVELDLSKPTSVSPPVEDEIYWGIEIPFGTASNPHTGVNTFYAIGD